MELQPEAAYSRLSRVVKLPGCASSVPAARGFELVLLSFVDRVLKCVFLLEVG